MRKGSTVGIQGWLSYRQFEKDGTKREVTEIIAERIELTGSKFVDAGETPETKEVTLEGEVIVKSPY